MIYFSFCLGGGEKYTREGTGGLNRAGWVFFRLLIVCVCVLLGWVGFFVGFLFLQRSVVCVKHKLIPEPVFSSAAAKRLCRLEQFDTHGSCARRFPPFLQLVEFKGGAGGEKRLPHCCRPIPRTLDFPSPPPPPPAPKYDLKPQVSRRKRSRVPDHLTPKAVPQLRGGLGKPVLSGGDGLPGLATRAARDRRSRREGRRGPAGPASPVRSG